MNDAQFITIFSFAFIVAFFVLSKGIEQALLHFGKIFFSSFGERIASWRYARALKRKV